MASSVPQPKLNILRPLHSPLCHSPHPVKDMNHSQAGAAGAGCRVSRSPWTQDLRPGAKAERLPPVHQTAHAEGTNGFSDAPSHSPFSTLPCQTFPSQSTEVTLGGSLSLLHIRPVMKPTDPHSTTGLTGLPALHSLTPVPSTP